jgi:hypothetical protein
LVGLFDGVGQLSKKDGTRGICSVRGEMKFATQKVIARDCEGSRRHLQEMECDQADFIKMDLRTAR